MQDFTFSNPTKVIFGNNSLDQLGSITAQYGKNVLLVTGQGSIKKSGLYDIVLKLLRDSQLKIFDLPGVLPNPRISKCIEGARICKENDIDVILAVGGGSVIDSAKVISVAAVENGDIWDFCTGIRPISKTLPVICIVTVAASGSECNHVIAIKNDLLHIKVGFRDVHLYPKVSFLVPKLTYTLSSRYTAYGGVDIIAHLLERYLTSTSNPLIQMRFKESLMKTVMESVEIAQKDTNDYEARSYLLWASSLALNGIFDAGIGVGFNYTHIIETELSSIYDNTHGAGLSVLLPAVMKCYIEKYTHTIARFAEKVMNIERKGRMTDIDIANEGMDAFREWIKKIGCPTTLKELGITNNNHFQEIARRASLVSNGPNEELTLQALNMYFK